MGWISTIRALGDVFNLKGLFTWHLVMTILMVCVWLILFVLTVWAFIKGKIFLARREEVLQDALERKLLVLHRDRSPRHSESGSEAYNKEAQGQV